MKKTLTINLGGIVFHIDEDAFEVLNSYLNTIRGYFDSSEGRDEIMGDIEARIAEMLQERNKGGKQVINNTDINDVIGVMGQPEDYLDEEVEAEQAYSTHTTTNSTKRLFRDTEGATIGGVCSGLGYYTGVDPIWFKLAFIAMVFLGLSGILVYIILWIIMPEARTTADKLAMKGRPITFDNIGKSVEDSINNVKKKLHNIDGSNARAYQSRFSQNVNKVVSFIGQLLVGFFKALGKLIGALFILGAFFGLMAVLFGTMLPINNIMFVNDGVPAGFHFQQITHLLYADRIDYFTSVTGGWLLTSIPLVALMMVGLYLTAKVKVHKYTGIGLAAAFVLGIILFTYGGLRTGVDFSTEKSVPSRDAVPTDADTLYFDVIDPRGLVTNSNVNFDYFADLSEEGVVIGDIKIDILPSKKDFAEIEIIKTARGKSSTKAVERAENIVYEMQMDSNVINLSPYLFIKNEDKFRKQEVKVNLRLPEGKTVYIPKEYQYLLHDVANYHNTWDQYMVHKYWTMTDSGLVSPDTNPTESLEYLRENNWNTKKVEEHIEIHMENLDEEIEQQIEEELENVEIIISEYESEQNI